MRELLIRTYFFTLGIVPWKWLFKYYFRYIITGNLYKYTI